jgi:site-specific recombinase XerD
MNADGFIKFMKHNKKSEKSIRDYIRCSQEFNEFLLTTKRNKSIDNANPKDINDYINIIEKKSKIHRHMGSLQTYYEYIDREDMVNTCAEIMTVRWLENYKL